MPLLDENRGLRVSPHVKFRETQDGVVLFDPSQGICVSINSTGSLIWKGISEGCVPDAVAQHVSERFNIPIEEARTDVHEFIQQLKDQRLFGNFNSVGSEIERRNGIGEFLMRCWRWATGSIKRMEKGNGRFMHHG
jgi:hypothetical protein